MAKIVPNLAMIYAFENFIPVVDSTSYVHPMATVTGNVIIGKHVYIGPGAHLRGDFGKIVVEDGANIQENCVVHMFPGVTVNIRKNAHIGHGAIIHGAEIGENSLIGMHAVLMDEVVIGKECIVGALSFVNSQFIVPDRKLVVGNPARILKDVSDQMIQWKSEGTALYQTLPERYQNSLREVMPLTEIPVDLQKQSAEYKIWKKTGTDFENPDTGNQEE